MESQSECEHVRRQMSEARSLMSGLEARLRPLELELALLVADRGRCVVADKGQRLASERPLKPDRMMYCNTQQEHMLRKYMPNTASSMLCTYASTVERLPAAHPAGPCPTSV